MMLADKIKYEEVQAEALRLYNRARVKGYSHLEAMEIFFRYAYCGVKPWWA